MLIQKLSRCEEFIAEDGTLLRELLHPDKQPLEWEQRDFVKSDQKQAMPAAGVAIAKNDI
jgi:hypothetical protein